MIPLRSDGTLHTGCVQKLTDELLEGDTVATFVRECRMSGESDLDDWKVNPKRFEKLCADNYKGPTHAKEPSEAWFALGAIRWIDYKHLTEFRAPYPDSRLSNILMKEKQKGRKLKWIKEIIGVHLKHSSSNLEGISQHWWTSMSEPP